MTRVATQWDFDDIRPYYDAEISSVLQHLIEEPTFFMLANYIWPGITQNELRLKAAKVKTAFDFQVEFMHGAIREIVKRSSTGLTYSGFDQLDTNTPYLFISNHRDIMLDSAILQILLVENGFQTSEITFGKNLMIPGFITEFGKLNRMFMVRREGNSRELYQISQQLSAYIRHTITDKKVSVWIAQRNGRTKDGNDITQTGLIKMLNISNNISVADGFKALNIVPITISYAYEPCDFLKARELYLSSMHAAYQKDTDEDIKSIIAGIKNPKGNIHLAIGKPLNQVLPNFAGAESGDLIKLITDAINSEINKNYRLNKTNYIAYDILNNGGKYAGEYTEAERSDFEKYLQQGILQMGMNTSDIRNLVLEIYANPIQNKNTNN